MKPTAILLLHCPDKQGIISEVTRFITDKRITKETLSTWTNMLTNKMVCFLCVLNGNLKNF